MPRRWPVLVFLGLTVALLAVLGSWVVVASHIERSLVQVRRLMEADRFAEARRMLGRVPGRWSGNPEWAYRLGVCEHAGGNIEAAVAAWASVDMRLGVGAAGRAGARTHAGGRSRSVQ